MTSAVVSCSDLAERLGYARASNLKDLAQEHAKKLNELGHIRVSRLSIPCGNGFRETDEPLFNRMQALYLIAKSGTSC